MALVRDVINKSIPLTGSKLLQALELAALPPLAGAGLLSESRGAETVMRATPTRRIVATRLVNGILGAATLIGPNRWEYAWNEVGIKLNFAWLALINGKTDTDVNREKCRNYAEDQNSAATALYGVELLQELITITVRPIPAGTPVLLREIMRSGDGQFLYFFEALNPTDVECNSGVATGLGRPKGLRKGSTGSGIISP